EGERRRDPAAGGGVTDGHQRGDGVWPTSGDVRGGDRRTELAGGDPGRRPILAVPEHGRTIREAGASHGQREVAAALRHRLGAGRGGGCGVRGRGRGRSGGRVGPRGRGRGGRGVGDRGGRRVGGGPRRRVRRRRSERRGRRVGNRRRDAQGGARRPRDRRAGG